MIRISLAALALLAGIPAQAQSDQSGLDARYDRALAAGYKALMLCSAIANAERAGGTRTAESVHEWELGGIQAPLDDIVRELPYEIVRGSNKAIRHVSVEWTDDMPPRYAVHRVDEGCSIYPIGFAEADLPPDSDVEPVQFRRGRTSATKGYNSFSLDREPFFDGTYGEGTRTTAVVVWNGLDDRAFYADGFDARTPQRTWSVAKSIAATIVGVTAAKHGLDLDASAGLGEGGDDPRRAISIDHLLRMASGRYSDTPGNRTDSIYWGGTGIGERATHWPLVSAPGSVYRYANNDTLMAIDAIGMHLAGEEVPEILTSLRMIDTVAERDWRGRFVLSSQVWATAPDLLRFGKAYLKAAKFGELTTTRLGDRHELPAGWVKYVSSPSGPQPEGRGVGYGAGFWLLNQSEVIPPDTFAAMGNRGQYVVIVPSRDVVIVRRGEDPAGTRFDIIAFTRDILDALEAE